MEQKVISHQGFSFYQAQSLRVNVAENLNGENLTYHIEEYWHGIKGLLSKSLQLMLECIVRMWAPTPPAYTQKSITVRFQLVTLGKKLTAFSSLKAMKTVPLCLRDTKTVPVTESLIMLIRLTKNLVPSVESCHTHKGAKLRTAK